MHGGHPQLGRSHSRKGTNKLKGWLWLQDAGGTNLYRIPYLHSSVSGSKCHSVFPVTTVSVRRKPECLSTESDSLAVVVTSSARVNNPGPHPQGPGSHTLSEDQSPLTAASHEGIINASLSAKQWGRGQSTKCQTTPIKLHMKRFLARCLRGLASRLVAKRAAGLERRGQQVRGRVEAVAHQKHTHHSCDDPTLPDPPLCVTARPQSTAGARQVF